MTWEASPLVVDGSRECVRLVAALPSDWTTDGERYVLHVMACDAFERESAPGLDNLAAWTGMCRGSIARIIARLLQPNDVRPALLVKTNASKGRATSRYRLQLSPTVTVPTETVTVSQLSPNRPPTETVNCLPTVSQPSTVGDPPSPSPDNPSLSAEVRAVANALGLQDDDEKLNSVDQMLKDNGAQKPMGWIRSCARNGDLDRLLDEAHGATRAKQLLAAEADRRRCPHGVINGKWACVECTSYTASTRAAALLRQLDASPTATRVACTEPGCRSELICQTRHVDNLTPTWRCLEHRPDPSTTTPKEDMT